MILMYHRIADEAFDPWGLAVSPRHFADHVSWLSRHRSVLPLVEFARLHRDGRLPADAVAITFDDGYACSADVAAPVLQRAGVPATVFLPAELVERGREFWWDELQRIVLDSRKRTMLLDGEEIDLGAKQEGDWRWSPGEQAATARQQAFWRLWSDLRMRSPDALDEAMQQLRDQAGDIGPARPSHRPMTAQDARRLRSSGIAFGSHALTHPSLPALETGEKARQVAQSLDRCEQLTGERPQAFAYPYGDCDSESERLVEAAGFLCACTTQRRSVEPESRLFALPRVHVANGSARRLKRMLAIL